MKHITIHKEGRTLWQGQAQDGLDAIRRYREEIGTEALDYDAVDPRWIYDLEFDFEPEE
jgi:hypothetical protein